MQMFMFMQRLVDQSADSNNCANVCSADVTAAFKDMQMFMFMQRLVNQSADSNNCANVCSADVTAAFKAGLESDIVHH